MDPLILGALFMGSLSLALAATWGVLGLVFYVMVPARPRQTSPTSR